MVLELKTRVEEMKLESAYQLRVCEQTYNEKIKGLIEKSVQEQKARDKAIDVSLKALS